MNSRRENAITSPSHFFFIVFPPSSCGEQGVVLKKGKKEKREGGGGREGGNCDRFSASITCWHSHPFPPALANAVSILQTSAARHGKKDREKGGEESSALRAADFLSSSNTVRSLWLQRGARAALTRSVKKGKKEKKERSPAARGRVHLSEKGKKKRRGDQRVLAFLAPAVHSILSAASPLLKAKH